MGRFIEAFEQQQRAPATWRQRIHGKRCFGDQRQRAFAAHEQFGQIELPIYQHVVEPVSAAIDSAAWPAIFDRPLVALDQSGD